MSALTTAPPITNVPNEPCPDFPDNSTWQRFGDYCYNIHSGGDNIPTDWHSARLLCLDQGADLVSIVDEQENSFIVSKVMFIFITVMFFFLNISDNCAFY